MSPEPYPCPSCGNAPEYDLRGGAGMERWQLRCLDPLCEMNIETDLCLSEAKALAVWNGLMEQIYCHTCRRLLSVCGGCNEREERHG